MVEKDIHALAGVVQLLKCRPLHQEVVGSIPPGQGTCPDYGLD